MKSVKSFLLAVLFVTAFCVSAYAGDQQTPACVQPPPPSSAVYVDSSTNSSTTDTMDIAESSDSLLVDALTALLSVL
ncbi:MAG: hypothetical protein ABR555_09910 [Pyrinomonadaceae bacterium]